MNAFARKLIRAAALLTVAGLAATPGRADDRDLLRNTQDDPYVFIILDVSGSMNWQPAGDAWAPANADDPAAKFYQAKSALYRVLKATDDINFGFATYNQDNLHAVHKHYLYKLAEGQTALPWIANASTLLSWPNTTEPITFGPNAGLDGGNDTLLACGTGPGLNQTGNNLLEARGELNRFPKLGFRGSPVTTTEFFQKTVGGNTYRFKMEWSLVSGSLGDSSVTVRMRLRRYGTNNTCNTSTYDSNNVDRTFVRYYTQDNNGTPFAGGTDFLMWERDADVGPSGEPAGFFDYTQTNPNGTCNGWEPNGTTNDDYNGYNIKQPGVADDPLNRCTSCLDRGDVIPLDWNEDVWLTATCPAGIACQYTNRDLILTRLAPNLIADGINATPNLRSGHYFQDTQTSGILRLVNNNQRPLVASGSTPIGFSMDNFRTWYNSWRPVAAAEDNRFGCKKVTLLIITDGDDTCPGMNPATVAGSLLNSNDVETYIIGFGIPTTGGNTLVATTCAGGGQAPDPDGPGPLPSPACLSSTTNDHLFLPNNEDELVNALVETFTSIKETASAFASAAAPTLQANVEDKVIISSFTPIGGQSTWAGRLDAFLKPVPVTGDGKPDRTHVCAPGDTSECLLWDAGDSQPDVVGGADYQPQGLLLQAPTEAEVDLADATTLQLGDGADERRVFYGQFETGRPGGTIWVSTPPLGNRKLLTFPVGDQDRRDLWEGMKFAFTPGNVTSETNAYDASVKMIAKTLWEKSAEITDPFDGSTSNITYLLGDVFHSNPRVLDQPGGFSLYTTDPYRSARLCNVDPNPTRTPPVSYRWFADRHLCRRKILFVGSNDGELHAFDAGLFQGPDCKLPTEDDRDGDGLADGDGDPIDGAFDNGTGKELFAYVPRQMLPHLQQLATETEQSWGIDNSTRVDDVFIDPAASVSGTATCLDREWRTVLIGSYREGGSGYFALDITQPDAITDSTNVPVPINTYVPSCLDGGTDCGNRAFPTALWEFIDSVPGNVDAQMDEDRNNWPDLGNTWSVPATARIRVCDAACTAASVEDRYVAVFGGGLGDPPTRPIGNYVYMVDIETGKVIWKKPVNGSVPADIATVIGGDGYLKTLYFGTTSGRVYKTVFESGPMRLVDSTIQTRVAGVDVNVTVRRIAGPVADPKRYDPFIVFQTNGTPIYHEIAAIYVQQRQTYALGIGTGNRWNLWEPTTDRGRFYTLLDTGFVDADRNGTLDAVCGGCPTPLNESVYEQLDPNTAANDLTSYLTDSLDATPGWFLNLGAGERVITEGFALSGITIFTSFLPDEVENPDGTCSRTGESHIFIVGTVSGAGYWFPDPDDVSSRERYFTSAYFTSAPFVERGATGNQTDPGSGGTNADQLTDSLVKVREELKSLFPPNCRFGNYTQNVKSLRQDTRIVFIAPIPICIEPTNFKEF